MDENTSTDKSVKVIDLRVIVKNIWTNRKLFYKVLPTVFVLSCAYILCIPRTYTSSLSLAPEMSNGTGISGTLGSLASSFGLDMGNMQTSDAISPLLYPDLMDDNGFIVDLFSVKVESVDGELSCSYYDYLDSYQKEPWWKIPIGFVRNLFKSKEKPVKGAGKQNPYILSKKMDDIAGAIKKNISIDFDKKTMVISISTKAQDPLICKTLADAVKERLQLYITQYRTQKARIDEAYYKQLADEAKDDYKKAMMLYANFSDANTNVTLETFRVKRTELENDMQLKYNTYSTTMAQYQAAKAKVQERTPAFTVVKGAAVPIKPSGPRRMLFVVGMCFLAFFLTTAWCLYKTTD